jgi:hypothetical protein
MTADPREIIIEELLKKIPPGWTAARKANGQAITNDVAAFVVCPRGHHAKIYFTGMDAPICLACTTKKDKNLRLAAEKIFGEPFSKRDATEGFLAVSLFLGFRGVSRGDAQLATPPTSTNGVLWINVRRRKTVGANTAEIIWALHATQHLPAKAANKLRVYLEERRAHVRAVPKLPTAMMANKYLGEFEVDLSEYCFENTIAR